jgi:hypothetical protein
MVKEGDTKWIEGKFDVHGSVHHSIIHIKNPTRCNSVSQFILYLYKAQHVLGDTPPIIVQQLHVQQPSTHAKPEAASAVLGSR